MKGRPEGRPFYETGGLSAVPAPEIQARTSAEAGTLVTAAKDRG